MSAREVPPFTVMGQDEILKQERRELELEDDAQPTALCLSGGGIRSAAFCLGALQAFAERRLLRSFNYLSTVSGGGYIGAWLTRCIAESTGIGGVAMAEECILDSARMPEPAELQRLRSFTNFLTPRPGLASKDTWAGVVLWLRNTLVNWLVFFPLMLAVAASAVLYVGVICALVSGSLAPMLSFVTGFIALIFLGVSVFHACINMPSHGHPDAGWQKTRKDQFGIDGRGVLRRIVLPALVWIFLVPWTLTPWLNLAAPVPAGAAFWSPVHCCAKATLWQIAILPVLSVVVCIVAYLAAWRREKKSQSGHDAIFRRNILRWSVSCIVSAAVLFAGAWVAAGSNAIRVAVAGPAWVMAAELLRSSVYVALRQGGLRTDLDREWVARLSGHKLRYVLLYSVIALTALCLPVLVFDRTNSKFWAAIIPIVGFLGGPVAAVMGKAVQSGFSYGVKQDAPPIWKRPDLLIAAAIVVFIAALFMLLGRLAAVIAHGPIPVPPDGAPTPAYAAGTFWMITAVACGVIILGAGAAFVVDWLVNLNRFSMQAVYRNRLVRAFLGTARPPGQRRPDRYAHFDPTDNVRMWDTFTARVPKSLFHIVNVTLNVTAGKDTARAERKGEPFVITPLHCGSASLGLDLSGNRSGAYISTAHFAGADQETGPDDEQRGITLGTAIALSGAAVSPNMGYHSSFFVAFIMTLFNVRLGAWLPNPGWQPPDGKTEMDASVTQRSGPTFAIPSLLRELAGLSDDRGKYIYLSDGGHFDNLGLYEMLRRRCRQIVVVDAGRDGAYGYFDLSHTLQRARIDLGIRVTFQPEIRVGAQKLEQSGAYGRIDYPATAAAPSQRGELLYLKPWLPRGAPLEVRAFQRIKPNFPHDTTANQFFTESDFESYRRLGEHLATAALSEARSDCHLDEVFSALRENQRRPAAETRGDERKGWHVKPAPADAG
jgi:hypothetical protein